MRKTFHICLSSHDEVMYRSEEDLNMGFNSLALAVHDTDSRLLAEGFIPTHNHKAVQTDDPKYLERRNRYTYTRYFNSKYKRLGSLGEKKSFILEVEGVFHIQTLLNYVNRQGLHHGLASTPFEYKHSSSNSYFRKALGKDTDPPLLLKEDQYLYLPEHKTLPEGYRMDAKGLILREDVVDTSYVEEIYITPRNFLFQMNKLTDEKSVQEQMEENNLAPITLDELEKGVKEYDPRAALVNEQGRVNLGIMTDLEMCSLIDNVILPRHLKDSDTRSIYLLSDRKRADIGNYLWKESKNSFGNKGKGVLCQKRTSASQIQRCLAIKRK